MRRMLAVLATSAALALSTALPAGATTGAAPGPSGSGNECVADVDTKKVTCFDTFREAAKAGSDGAITDADNPKELNAALASYREDWGTGRTWLGTATWDSQWQGDALYFWGDHACATGNGEDYAWDLSGSRWDDQLSSLTPSSVCWIELFQFPARGGAKSEPFKSPAGDLGWWNDRTSTITFV
ncbi:hypothetical protein [Streptomyces clavuligerus]|uniref:Secreted protein n=1 Tax=Streptomyces clavuligerus TaxID=1901 RepID=B5GTM9_STRCL|nr:hypothetical protein [Streptomyces clavuligerus]EDY49675.1 hypothetical protein SSCG_02777 [Streptomyces clavuligerus]EFG04096.1 Hypothetical protein SCLAV_p0609 [Streptomyces clavuligerus]MBY6307417.1 hypothetical protein [Streptomyces clavuligerus]QCS10023.1 hypothetical protein CRV15_31060 [Streptomyces clavuligerus]QPJ97932.1 hypothetical protein GE265_33385 [Streptomyces clavuligerus]